MVRACQIFAETTENVTVNLKSILITLISASHLVGKSIEQENQLFFVLFFFYFLLNRAPKRRTAFFLDSGNLIAGQAR